MHKHIPWYTPTHAHACTLTSLKANSRGHRLTILPEYHGLSGANPSWLMILGDYITLSKFSPSLLPIPWAPNAPSPCALQSILNEVAVIQRMAKKKPSASSRKWERARLKCQHGLFVQSGRESLEASGNKGSEYCSFRTALAAEMLHTNKKSRFLKWAEDQECILNVCFGLNMQLQKFLS